MGEEFDLIVITKNYVLAVYGLLSKVKNKTVLLQCWLTYYISFWSVFDSNRKIKFFKADWRNSGKIEDS